MFTMTVLPSHRSFSNLVVEFKKLQESGTTSHLQPHLRAKSPRDEVLLALLITRFCGNMEETEKLVAQVRG